jgi:hypothetical protein
MHIDMLMHMDIDSTILIVKIRGFNVNMAEISPQ